jgi:hypothetical protein
VCATSSAENGVPSENEIPLRNLKVICFPSFDTFHDCASSGSKACVCRFMRTNTPPVKYRIATDASSSTFNGSNVFGSERRQNLSSPPLCAAAKLSNMQMQTKIKVANCNRSPAAKRRYVIAPYDTVGDR